MNSQSVESSGITKDYKEALFEYIWNGLEANATQVEISIEPNGLLGISRIIIKDNGDGINYYSIEDTFGAFLASQKRGLSLQIKTKENKGKGRFSFFSYAGSILWDTVYTHNGNKEHYEIEINSNKKNEFSVSNPVKTYEPTGTTVCISEIDGIKSYQLSLDEIKADLLKEFAWYLFLNKERKLLISVNGQALDYSDYINTEFSRAVSICVDDNTIDVTVIVWKERIKEKFCVYYLDKEECIKGKTTTRFNRNTVNFYHSVFVKGDCINDKFASCLNGKKMNEDQIEIDEENKERALVQKVRVEVQKVIEYVVSEYMSKHAEEAIREMIKRDSFPRFSNDVYGSLRKRDLVTLIRELYKVESKIFYKLKPIQEKSLIAFLNLLLNSDERENMLDIIQEIVGLTAVQRHDFANILRKTKLTSIVETIGFIEGRYKVIEGLKQILFSQLSNYANERDHIQKIVEQHYWLFGEQYHLVTADKTMKTALQKYEYYLYGSNSPDTKLLPDEEEMRRMDIFACGARKIEDASGNELSDNLIVELKAPKVVLTKKVFRQIEDYMDFIRKQPSFNSQFCQWKFMAVCNEIDENVKSLYKTYEIFGRKGLALKKDNYEIYVLTWSDIFYSFELRHKFLLDKLQMDKEAVAAELSERTGTSLSRDTVNAITEQLCPL